MSTPVEKKTKPAAAAKPAAATPAAKTAAPAAPPAAAAAAPAKKAAAPAAAAKKAPAAEPVAPPAPAAPAAAPKKKRSAAEMSEPAAAPAPAPSMEEETETPVIDLGDVILAKLKKQREEYAEVIQSIRAIVSSSVETEKQMGKYVKLNKKRPSSRKPRARDPSQAGKVWGFQAPAKISNQMADFMGVPHGTTAGRHEVMQHIRKYVTDQGLAEGKYLNLDATLKSLFHFPADVKPTLFNIQKVLSTHVETKAKKLAAAAAAST